MATNARLGAHVQMSIGSGLRNHLKPSWSGMSGRLREIVGRLASLDSAGRTKGDPQGRAAEVESAGSAEMCFDPETLQLIDDALHDASGMLQHLRDTQLNTEELAKRILELAAQGERSAARLSARALVSSIAPHTRSRPQGLSER